MTTKIDIWIIIAAVLITALIVGSGVYLWQRAALEREKQAVVQVLQDQIDNLQNQIAQLRDQLEEKIKDETANWKTYRNEKYGFEVKYPEDWIAEKRSLSPYLPSGIRVEFKAPLKDKQVFIAVRPKEDEGMIREAYSIVSETKISVDGVIGSKIVGAGQKDEAPQEIFVLVSKGDYVYHFYLPPFYQEETFLDQILSTFQFVD